MTKAQERAAEIAAQVLCAYLSRNKVSADDLPALGARTYSALEAVFASPATIVSPVEPPTPDQIAASITADALVSFENGRRYRSLRRHLNQLGLTEDQYRAKWGLPADYPLVAQSFSDLRSSAARAQRFSGVALAAE
ncbi:MucR family transcriptional regulator [Caulobacter sp. FWC2]|uniref:MucR family transcriptional regulator n=1 Tax=Caulobacter sp. FWC2 TaxID=69664 RepID=UPI000C150146|nr:MucR family transcriptional regulator [Caulobacter sp. FWC2]PIB91856.1 MucR family transcriptional regulator [Caulobacter sp. FWC2]